MAKRLQHRGGTTSQHSTFTGAVREVTVDTDKNTLVVHDGATAGGHPLATATNFASTGIDDNATSTAITIDSSQNVDVNGTVTADGLTVATNTVLGGIDLSGNNAPAIKLRDSSTSAYGYLFAQNNGGLILSADDSNIDASSYLSFRHDGKETIKVTSGGDISFYEDTGTTAKLFWDASTERLGIDTTSPSTALQIGNAVNSNNVITFGKRVTTVEGNKPLIGATSSADYGGNYSSDLGICATSGTGKIIFYTGNDASGFGTGNNEERMRIDGSGHILLGKTATGITNAGVSVLGGSNAGTLEVRRNIATANSSSVGYISRGSSDGNILTFYKDTTAVGSIGSRGTGTQTYFGSGDAGLLYVPDNNQILPYNLTTNVPNNNTISLGGTADTFKDLYLGGGVYLGGTGTANKLDDYEEGSWTPTAVSGVTAVSGSAKYRKVGSLVFVQAYLDGIAGKSANNLIIGGLPFSTTSSGYAIGNIEGGSTSGKMGTARPSSSSSSVNFYYPNTSTLQRTNYLGDDLGNFIIFSLTYHVA